MLGNYTGPKAEEKVEEEEEAAPEVVYIVKMKGVKWGKRSVNMGRDMAGNEPCCSLPKGLHSNDIVLR